MPGSQGRSKYSRVTGTVFLFNLIVGTGALALPGALQKAGWITGILLIVVLAFFSFVTVTFIVECLAVSNAVCRKRYGSNQHLIEETPLVPDQQESSDYEIIEKYEIGQMGILVLPKWCQVVVYICLCVYLYGDLTIYALVIGKTCSHVLCTYKSANASEMNMEELCWKNHGLTKLDVYRLSVFAFIFIMGPFIFFNLHKTKFLQFFTAGMRWLAFFIMLIWSIYKLLQSGKKGDPPAADIRTLPTLFGTLVYSFMCQHSLPGLLHPVSNKSHLYRLIGTDFIMIVVFYLSLALTAAFTFQQVEDLYTLNFWEEASKPHTTLFPKILAYYLAWFPVFTLSTSFPIIGITLRNNLRFMVLKDTPFVWYYDKLLFPLITLIPPFSLAIAISNLQLLVGIIGSYAGACIQYLIPTLLVTFARRQSQELNTENIYASPFKSKFWIWAVYIWMFVSLIFITINYINYGGTIHT